MLCLTLWCNKLKFSKRDKHFSSSLIFGGKVESQPSEAVRGVGSSFTLHFGALS
jgi:hypothetical protein